MVPESRRPWVVVACTLIGLIGAALAVGCLWLAIDLFRSGFDAFETVGVARPFPAWMALIGFAIGSAAGGQLAWSNGAYLVRVIRRRPRLVPAPPPER